MTLHSEVPETLGKRIRSILYRRMSHVCLSKLSRENCLPWLSESFLEPSNNRLFIISRVWVLMLWTHNQWAISTCTYARPVKARGEAQDITDLYLDECQINALAITRLMPPAYARRQLWWPSALCTEANPSDLPPSSSRYGLPTW